MNKCWVESTRVIEFFNSLGIQRSVVKTYGCMQG